MHRSSPSKQQYSRREFGKLALASVPAVGVLGHSAALLAWQAKPNSTWGGVPFGIFAPYRFGPEASDLEGALNALVKFGVSNTELSAALVERYVGAPQPAPAAARAGGAGAAGRAMPPAAAPGAAPAAAPTGAAPGGGGGGRGGGRAAQTPEQQAAARAQAEALAKWRTSVPMSRLAEVR